MAFYPNSNKEVNLNYVPPASVKNEELTEKRVAREILNMIELVCFSREYLEYRCEYGSNWQREFIRSKINLRGK